MKNILSAEDSKSLIEETKEILSRMAEDGDILTEPREIDFNHLFEDEESAARFIQVAAEQGFSQAESEFWDERHGWQTSVHIHMVPSSDPINEIQTKLTLIAHSLNGRPDGWGCMEVVAPESTE